MPITGATVSGSQVTVTFKSSQYTNLQYVGSVYIVPESIWSKLSGDPSAFTDTDPIGSGPYVLSQFSAGTGVVLTPRGRSYAEQVRKSLGLLADAHKGGTRADIEGMLRVSSTAGFCSMC